jgi:hypothetical protein
MNVQRASGRFDFFTSPQERDELFRMLDEFYNKPRPADKNTGAGPGGHVTE